MIGYSTFDMIDLNDSIGTPRESRIHGLLEVFTRVAIGCIFRHISTHLQVYKTIKNNKYHRKIMICME